MFRRYHLIFFGDFMICPNCRAEIPDESLSCPRCGTPFPLPQAVEAELVHPDSSGSPHEEYRQATQSAHFTRIFYTTFPSGRGIPPACLPTFISLGLALAAAFKYGILAAIGFLVFAGIGRLITFFMTVQHWMEGRAINPWILHITTRCFCWLLVAWLSGAPL